MTGAVLVTGATGGLGRIAVAHLRAAGRAVVATGRNRVIGAHLEQLGARFAVTDLATDPLAPLFDGVESVWHLAALSAPWGTREAFESANVTSTRRLLAAARKAGAARFLYASTPSIYTEACDRLSLSETSPLPPRAVNHYAATKLAAERAVLAAAGEGFACLALRPRAIVSPYDSVLLPRLLRAAGKGVLPLPGGGKALVELTDARDIAAGFAAADARAEALSGRAFNLSGGAALPLRDIAAHVFAARGQKLRIIPVPRRALLAAAAVLEGASALRPGQPEPPITRYGVKALGWSQTFDLSAAKRALGWQPQHHPLAAIDWALTEMGHA